MMVLTQKHAKFILTGQSNRLSALSRSNVPTYVVQLRQTYSDRVPT
jgi:hypothetical protein